MAACISTNQFVVCIWGNDKPPSNIEEYVTKMKEKAGDDGIVRVENASMFLRSNLDRSTFDVVLSGTMSDDASFLHPDEILAEILRILKPNGSLYICEPKEKTSVEMLQSKLTLVGFTTFTEVASTDESLQLKCQKPNFEVGKSSKLSFAKKSTKSEVANIWTLSANDANDENIDIIDSDALLDANDLKKPDFSGVVTDCGTNKAGKRKACKGCTCGLVEELSGAPAPAVKSACGSCNLGDAFRCASCPYLGMPRFKPGEQITLSDRQLKSDI